MEKWLNKSPMGWNSFDYYNTSVTEADVKANADYMAKHLKGFGWEYIVVDIAWYYSEEGEERDNFAYIPFAKVEIDEYSISFCSRKGHMTRSLDLSLKRDRRNHHTQDILPIRRRLFLV